MAFDFGGVSLSASDPNPSIDQYDDGGSSDDVSSIISTAGQWGTEIAGVITGNPAPSVAPQPSYSGGYASAYPRPNVMSSTTKLLIGALVLGIGWVAFQHAG